MSSDKLYQWRIQVSWYLTLPMLRLLSSQAQERNVFWKLSKPCPVGDVQNFSIVVFIFLQALCDQQQFERADEYFSTAQELEPDNGNIYVHRG